MERRCGLCAAVNQGPTTLHHCRRSTADAVTPTLASVRRRLNNRRRVGRSAGRGSTTRPKRSPARRAYSSRALVQRADRYGNLPE